MVQQWAWPFMDPVDTANFTDYLSIVKRPMDFGTIKKHLASRCDKCGFKSETEFAECIRLVLNNALLYSKVDKGVVGSVYCAAEHLLKVFEESYAIEMEEMKQKYSRVRRRNTPLKLLGIAIFQRVQCLIVHINIKRRSYFYLKLET